MRISDWSSDVCSSDLAQDEHGEDAFSAGIGAEAIRVLLENLDLEQERVDLMEDLATTKSELKPKKIIKRLKVVESLIESGNRPEWMILEVVPVIPPELRPLVPLEDRKSTRLNSSH